MRRQWLWQWRDEIRHFHVVVVQQRQRNVTKKRDARAKLLICWSKGLFTWRWGTPDRWGNMWRVTPPTSCKRGQMKMRDYMDRRVTSPKRVTSPSWGPPPPCKQALRSANQQLCTCITLFCDISLPLLHDYDVKVPYFTFLSRTGTLDNFLFLFLNSDTN